ncbi:MAG: AzlD domain-containing protein [Bacillota bacterium]|nr:AzlD domain-containing protein [Bacillota bacterium]
MVRWEIFILILGMGLVTYLTRVGAFLVMGNREMPEKVKVFLKYIPVAMLTAIIVPELVMPQGEVALNLSNHYLLAGVGAIAIAYFTKNVIYTVVVGLTIVIMMG